MPGRNASGLSEEEKENLSNLVEDAFKEFISTPKQEMTNFFREPIENVAIGEIPRAKMEDGTLVTLCLISNPKGKTIINPLLGESTSFKILKNRTDING